MVAVELIGVKYPTLLDCWLLTLNLICSLLSNATKYCDFDDTFYTCSNCNYWCYVRNADNCSTHFSDVQYSTGLWRPVFETLDIYRWHDSMNYTFYTRSTCWCIWDAREFDCFASSLRLVVSLVTVSNEPQRFSMNCLSSSNIAHSLCNNDNSHCLRESESNFWDTMNTSTLSH